MASPRIRDVALLAGVSTATVSRVFNQPNTVSDATRQAVVEAAAKSGYRINHTARNLRRGRTGSIVVLVPNLGNSFFSEILSGIETTLAAAKLSVLIADTTSPNVPGNPLADYLLGGKVDGVISLDGTLPTLLADVSTPGHNILPIVYACEWPEESPGPCARVDNQAGASLAIAHLAELGHTDIGLVWGPPENILTKYRKLGAVQELQRRGLECRGEWQIEGDFSLGFGRVAAERFLSLAHRPSALFCASDEIALGVISRLHEDGVTVPDDVSIIGFDDIELASTFIPALTTIRQPRTELGSAAANLLLHILDNAENHTTDSKVLPVELITRASTKMRDLPN